MDKSRQRFEEALKSGFNTKHLSLELQRKDGCGTYRWGETERCWEMWQASRESLEKERDEAIKHLILVFRQYANNDHLFMSAGEDACEFLDDLGYGIDTGRTLELTEKGKNLIKEYWE